MNGEHCIRNHLNELSMYLFATSSLENDGTFDMSNEFSRPSPYCIVLKKFELDNDVITSNEASSDIRRTYIKTL